MRPASQPMWALMWASAHLAAVARAASILDIGLVFPRTNETYEPTKEFPIVFAMQNSKLAEHLKPSIWYRLLNATAGFDPIIDGSIHDFNWTRASENDPYFLWSHLAVEGEGRLRLLWKVAWYECDVSRDGVTLGRNSTYEISLENFLVDFEIKAGSRKADLVAATGGGGDGENCPNEGVGIEVTDKTHEVPVKFTERQTCAVLGSSSSTPTSNPCKAKIDKAAVESMRVADLEWKCRGFNKPEECPKEDLAHPRLTAAPAGVASLSAVLGAVFFLA